MYYFYYAFTELFGGHHPLPLYRYTQLRYLFKLLLLCIIEESFFFLMVCKWQQNSLKNILGELYLFSLCLSLTSLHVFLLHHSIFQTASVEGYEDNHRGLIRGVQYEERENVRGCGAVERILNWISVFSDFETSHLIALQRK